MSDKTLPAIKNATVKVDVTYEDGTTRTHDFYLDAQPGESPISLSMEVNYDIEDVTDLTADRARRLQQGARRTISLSINGRGPNTPTPTEQMLRGFYGDKETN